MYAGGLTRYVSTHIHIHAHVSHIVQLVIDAFPSSRRPAVSRTSRTGNPIPGSETGWLVVHWTGLEKPTSRLAMVMVVAVEAERGDKRERHTHGDTESVVISERMRVISILREHLV